MKLTEDKIHAIETAKGLIAKRPIYLDTETTGRGPSAEIIEIAILDTDGSVLLDTLVKPLGRIPPDATRIHGITDGMVVRAPAWMEVWPQVKDVVTDRMVGIYNADFDLKMIRQSNLRHKINERMPSRNHFCIMKLYAQYYGDWNDFHGNYRWQRLAHAAQQCKLEIPNTHRAKDDARLARAVLLSIANTSQ